MNIPRWHCLSATIAAFALAAASCNRPSHPARPEAVTDEDEKAAEEALLAAKLSGPRYFTAHVADPAPGDERWIWVDDALSQVPRITAERHLGAAGNESIRQLIAQLAEPHPYRMVGGQRINLLRLNLSLDKIK